MKRNGLRVLDLFCGAGGFSEGFRQAGYNVVLGIDNWRTALDTHTINRFGASLDYDMFKLVDEGGYEEAKRLASVIQERYGRIDVLIGSPPCTEFSYAKKGGTGDIEKGMLLVRAFLVMVAALQPKFWLMENVPRLKRAIETESMRENTHGWHVDLARLGVDENMTDTEHFDGESLLIPYGQIYKASEYGAPQDRSRFIAGNLPVSSVNSVESRGATTLRDIIDALDTKNMQNDSITDPNYPWHKLPKSNLRDHFYDTRIHPMYWEEMRYLKRRHVQYGRMSFPDDLDRPARTIMATSNPSSREAIVIDTGETMPYQGKPRPVYRQPTVREVACIQGFPISFQFTGPSLSIRYKQVGNAVPCQLARALALGILKEFESKGFEDDEQNERYLATCRKLEELNYAPLISVPESFTEEANDFAQAKFMTFKARPSKHIRRKLLSGKPFNTSGILVFENTEWDERGRRFGGLWKSCIQLGQGKRFYQVFLDQTSLSLILDAIEKSLNQEDDTVQLTLDSFRTDSNHELNVEYSHVEILQRLIGAMINEIDSGFPIVPLEWIEFPGYDSANSEQYLMMTPVRVARLPDATLFQKMFTTEMSEETTYVGPIDFFDGLDFLMLKHLSRDLVKWIHQIHIPFDNLHDDGNSVYNRRISQYASNHLSGNIPLVTLIAAFLSVHVLYRMYERIETPSSVYLQSLRNAWLRLSQWIK